MTSHDAMNWTQYYVLNEALNMPPNVAAVQVGHAATMLTLHYLVNNQDQNQERFRTWLENGQPKSVLRCPADALMKLAEQGFLSVRDRQLGTQEEPALTVVALPLMQDSEAAAYIAELLER